MSAKILSFLKRARDFESAKVSVLRQLKPSSQSHKIFAETFYKEFSESQLLERRKACFAVTQEEVAKVVDLFINQAIISDKSSKVIFGAKSNNLEGFVSRGWRIEKYFQDISLDIDRFNVSMDIWAEKIKQHH